MAETIIDNGLAIKRYRRKFFSQYVRQSRFEPYMGPSENNIIVTLRDLEANAGDEIAVPFVGEIEGAGVTGSQMLEGNEAPLDTTSMRVRVAWRRQGVVVPKSEQSKSEIDLLEAARPRLRRWFANKMRSDILRELGAVTAYVAAPTEDDMDVQTSVPYATATESQKDAWLALNSDRVLFGKDISNNSSNDHSVSLANIDTTNDKFTAATALKAKRMAKEADIHPYNTDDGEEWFVFFLGPRAFRDAGNDPDIKAANTYAAQRNMETNPIFVGGDLVYQGMIFREEMEIAPITGVGASSSDVEPIYVCGQQAIAAAWGQTPTPQQSNRDYNFRKGVGMEELVGVKKISKRGVQHGQVTWYVSASADS